ncbi:hypothetical protein N752_21235 [Desulforamulus aquiferis]|nr:hypothetical protein N752_21235 [Desulforamulus aquiferis]
MAKGVLVDLTKCVGCGSCTVACKLWNDIKFDSSPAVGEQVKLTDKNWTVVNFNMVQSPEGTPVFRFVKQQCLHCQDPACASACFAKHCRKLRMGQ